MDPNEYRKKPLDSRNEAFEGDRVEEFDNWDQPEDDIIGRFYDESEIPILPGRTRPEHDFRPEEAIEEFIGENAEGDFAENLADFGLDELQEDRIYQQNDKNDPNDSGLIVRSENRTKPEFRGSLEDVQPPHLPKNRDKKGPRIIIENAFPVVEPTREPAAQPVEETQEEETPKKSEKPEYPDYPERPYATSDLFDPLNRDEILDETEYDRDKISLSELREEAAEEAEEENVYENEDEFEQEFEEESEEEEEEEEPSESDSVILDTPSPQPETKTLPRPLVRSEEQHRESTASEAILEVRNLSVEFREHIVLEDISFSIRRGDTVAIIGESGCGKTVLLKTLIALLAPTRGTVLFDGKDLSTLSDRELTRERTRYGFVFQQAALFDSMSIAENIAFPLRQHTQRSEMEVFDFVLHLIREVGLPKSVLEKKPAELSGGMRKRVGFARALAMGPELMLYDEPTTGLDPIMSDVINELMLRTKEIHNIGGILVTHDMSSAKKVADRIIMLYPFSRLKPNESQMIFDGTPREIERSPDRRVSQFLRGEAGERLFEFE